MVMSDMTDKSSGNAENWGQLSPAQKRQHRLNNLLKTEDINFVSPEAERAYMRALVILERAHGKDHKNTKAVASNLAVMYRQMGREEDAKRIEIQMGLIEPEEE